MNLINTFQFLGSVDLYIYIIFQNIFIGGIDTIAVAMVWAISELVKTPQVMQKLQGEIRTSLGRKSKVDINDLPKLKFLK